MSAFLSLSAADADAAEHTPLSYIIIIDELAARTRDADDRPGYRVTGMRAVRANRVFYFLFFILPRFVLFTRFYSCYFFFRFVTSPARPRDAIASAAALFIIILFFPFSSVAVLRNTNTVYVHPTQ